VKVLNKNKLSLAVTRILIMRYSSLGDVVLTNPVLDQLEKAYPKAEIFYATKDRFASVVEFHPAVTRVIPLAGGGLILFLKHLSEIKSLQPTIVLDLHNSLRTRLIRLFLKKAVVSVYEKEAVQRRLIVKKLRVEPSLHTVHKYLKALEPLGILSSSPIRCQVHVSEISREFAENYFNRHPQWKGKWIVGLGPGATWRTKQWLPEYYAKLASRWGQNQKAQLLWFGSDKEVDLIRSIQSQMTVPASERGLCLAGELNLEQSSALLGLCQTFVGSDSGLIHLASGRGVPVTVIYGSTTPALGFEPWGKHQVAQVESLDCRPCDVHGKNACPLGHFKCMKDLTVDLVEKKVGLLTGNKG
jgi:lipopolysaccharide heptosyltransferase II